MCYTKGQHRYPHFTDSEREDRERKLLAQDLPAYQWQSQEFNAGLLSPSPVPHPLGNIASQHGKSYMIIVKECVLSKRAC